MKLQIKNFILVAMLALVTIGGTTSCSSKKKLAKKEYEAKVEQAKADLNAIIERTTEWTLEEQAARVDEIEKMDLQNQEVNDLIVKAREVIAREKAEAERIAEEERLRQIEEQKKNQEKPKTSLSDYFAIIAAAPNADVANEKIAEALQMFASPDIPVLIIVYHMGDIIDYDAPTTAERYLNYIKDQKKVAVRVNDIKYDDNGKITELELIKN
jgi:TolA-binding protein